MDSARQAASWEGKLEWGSTELGRQAFWEVGMWDGTRRRATGKDNSMAVQEGEVDRRVTGRISKDPETFKQECMGWGGTCRGTGWPMWSERTGSGWGLRGGCTVALRRVQSVGDAMSALLSLHFSSTLSTTQSQKRWLKVVSKSCKINKPNSK